MKRRTEDDSGSGSERSIDDMSSEESVHRRRLQKARRRSRKNEVEIMNRLTGLEEKVNEIHKLLVTSLRNLPLWTNGRNKDDDYAVPRSQLNQVQPRYKLILKFEAIDEIEKGQIIQIGVVLVDCSNNEQTVQTGPLASATVELVVVHAEFNQHDNEFNWSREDFERSIEKPKKAQQGNSVIGDVDQSLKSIVSNGRFNLCHGAKCHRGSKIFRNSGNKKIRLAVMVVSPTTDRVLEGLSNPFYVRGHDRPKRLKVHNRRSKRQRSDIIGQPQSPFEGNMDIPSTEPSTSHRQESLIQQNQDLDCQTFPQSTNNRTAVYDGYQGQNDPVANMQNLWPNLTQGPDIIGQPELHQFQGNTHIPCTEPSTSQGQQALIPQNQGSYWQNLMQLTNNQTGTQHNTNQIALFPVHLLLDRPNVELSKCRWNLLNEVMPLCSLQPNLNNGGLPTKHLMPEHLGSIIQKQVMRTHQRGGVLIEPLEPEDSDEEQRLKRKMHSKYRLRFVNKVCKTYYKMDPLKADDGNLLKVALFDENNRKITSGSLSLAPVEIVVLHGDFNNHGHDYWSLEEFTCSVVCPRPGKEASVLGGNRTLVLSDGEASIGDAFFQETSFCARKGKFKLGVRLANSQQERIQEGISKQFLVKDRPSGGTRSMMSLVGEKMDIKLHMLEAITNNFSDERKVGSGLFGAVYKGVYNGQEIAVKKLYCPPQGFDDTAFDNDLQSLCKIRHTNLVRLIGYCHDSHEPRRELHTHEGQKLIARKMERLLCFEYMPGGSLEKYLTDESSGLEWATRYKIIKGICEGLHYLHSELEQPIIHMDLKPGNILLDDNMVPKIADFGLSRIFRSTITRQTEIGKGKLGHIPPEYRDAGIISPKYDVFSLGVIVIKILNGDNGNSRRYKMTRQQFVDLVTGNWKLKLKGTSGYSSRETNIQQVKTCISMALRCVDSDRNRRPRVMDIINELKKLETLELGTK